MLEVEHLHVSYGHSVAVNGFSMQAESGQITAVIGSNGAGKTTLLKSICGLVKVQSGRIAAFHSDIQGLSTAEIVSRGICLVPEGRELFPRMTVADNLMVGAFLRRDKAAIARDLAKVYGYFPVLERKAKLPARSLSGGEQQMIAFGRALMAGPKILLLDEPSIGLAPLVEIQLMQALRQLTDETGIAVILVEQNAQLALQVSDRAYVLDLGTKALEGAAADLLTDPRVKQAYLGI
ncbi:ABC transporter ATP-binding protein [Tabrizicola sp.]|uniref:ABC transporter ATP-binding protein n=1 Tax=Tabrizicola sp. TaxID=2005166 RepID=UPI002FDE4137